MKEKLTLSVNGSIVREAHRLGLNVSEFLEAALFHAIYGDLVISHHWMDTAIDTKVCRICWHTRVEIRCVTED